MKVGHQPHVQTKTVEHCANPRWMEAFAFGFDSLNDVIKIVLYDYRVIGREFLGELWLGSIFKLFTEQGSHDLLDDGPSDKLVFSEKLHSRHGQQGVAVQGTITFSLHISYGILVMARYDHILAAARPRRE